MPKEATLASCPLNSQSPVILIPSILIGMTKILHILPKYINVITISMGFEVEVTEPYLWLSSESQSAAASWPVTNYTAW